MTTEEFVKAFHTEKQDLLNEYISDNSESEVAQLIKSLNLNVHQSKTLKKVLDSSFTDIFYSILLGLDGCAAIGGIQEIYDLKDESGKQLSGEIEGYAYEYFQVNKNGNSRS